MIEIVVTDTETGETSSQTIEDDFVIITAGRHYVASHNVYPRTGTHQLTIKLSEPGEDADGRAGSL